MLQMGQFILGVLKTSFCSTLSLLNVHTFLMTNLFGEVMGLFTVRCAILLAGTSGAGLTG